MFLVFELEVVLEQREYRNIFGASFFFQNTEPKNLVQKENKL